ISVVGRDLARGSARAGVTFVGGAGDEWTERTGRFIGAGGPEESVLRPRLADDPPRVDRETFAVGAEARVLTLRIDDRQAHLDGAQLVSPHAAIEDLVLSRGAVERPALFDLGDRHGKWPVIVA